MLPQGQACGLTQKRPRVRLICSQGRRIHRATSANGVQLCCWCVHSSCRRGTTSSPRGQGHRDLPSLGLAGLPGGARVIATFPHARAGSGGKLDRRGKARGEAPLSPARLEAGLRAAALEGVALRNSSSRTVSLRCLLQPQREPGVRASASVDRIHLPSFQISSCWQSDELSFRRARSEVSAVGGGSPMSVSAQDRHQCVQHRCAGGISPLAVSWVDGPRAAGSWLAIPTGLSPS